MRGPILPPHPVRPLTTPTVNTTQAHCEAPCPGHPQRTPCPMLRAPCTAHRRLGPSLHMCRCAHTRMNAWMHVCTPTFPPLACPSTHPSPPLPFLLVRSLLPSFSPARRLNHHLMCLFGCGVFRGTLRLHRRPCITPTPTPMPTPLTQYEANAMPWQWGFRCSRTLTTALLHHTAPHRLPSRRAAFTILPTVPGSYWHWRWHRHLPTCMYIWARFLALTASAPVHGASQPTMQRPPPNACCSRFKSACGCLSAATWCMLDSAAGGGSGRSAAGCMMIMSLRPCILVSASKSWLLPHAHSA